MWCSARNGPRLRAGRSLHDSSGRKGVKQHWILTSEIRELACGGLVVHATARDRSEAKRTGFRTLQMGSCAITSGFQVPTPAPLVLGHFRLSVVSPWSDSRLLFRCQSCTVALVKWRERAMCMPLPSVPLLVFCTNRDLARTYALPRPLRSFSSSIGLLLFHRPLSSY